MAAFLRSCKYWKHVNEVICPWERSVVPTPENDLFPKHGPGDPPFSQNQLWENSGSLASRSKDRPFFQAGLRIKRTYVRRYVCNSFPSVPFDRAHYQ